MFDDITFKSYLPVFNIWAICLPSAETGIGVNSRPKDTVFQLYRDGTQLRGIYCGDQQAAREVSAQARQSIAPSSINCELPLYNLLIAHVPTQQACRLVGEDGCDFPSMIGNDNYYGGLGGEFVIGTRSLTTGTIVLRRTPSHPHPLRAHTPMIPLNIARLCLLVFSCFNVSLQCLIRRRNGAQLRQRRRRVRWGFCVPWCERRHFCQHGWMDPLAQRPGGCKGGAGRHPLVRISMVSVAFRVHTLSPDPVRASRSQGVH